MQTTIQARATRPCVAAASSSRPRSTLPPRHAPSAAAAAPRRGRRAFRPAAASYSPPSLVGATAFDVISQKTIVVPDTVLLGKTAASDAPTAATVSAAVLAGLAANPATGVREFQVAIERALSDPSAKGNRIDTALANVGALFAKRVSGAVSTEVDPRVARDSAAIIEHADNLLSLYAERGVDAKRVLLRIPATWEGIEAARKLESEGKKTHLILVSSFVQAVAAAQSGASLQQTNIGSLADWYRAHPNFIRNPKGPREDSGFDASGFNPGIELAKRIWCFTQKYYAGKTRVMVSGIRSRDDALALAGVDFLVAGPKVMEALREMPTRKGYNDGLSAASGTDDDDEVPLNEQLVAAAEFDDADRATVTKQLFEEGLGTVGRDLLEQGLKKLVADVDCLSSLDSMVQGHE